MNAAIIFLILTALMVTGMPVSIALGLTVLSFLFGFTPLEFTFTPPGCTKPWAFEMHTHGYLQFLQ